MGLNRRIVLRMLVVVIISGGAATIVGGYMLWHHFRRQLQNRVRQDLNAAQAFHNHGLETMVAALRYTALGERFSEAVGKKESAYLAPRLAAVSESATLDVLYVTDARGYVIHRAHRRGVSGDSVTDDRLVSEVLRGSDTVAGTVLIPIPMLEEEAPSLARRVKIRILPTPRAAPLPSAELDAGMMLCAAVPVRGIDGRLLGVLRAGVLLNGNHALVDQVQNTLFHGELYRGKPLGTATVFQRDVRVSTNVLRKDGTRATGTRASADVYDRVFRRKEAWLGEAWVVNDWYVSAYAPICDMDGEPVGMLCVAIVEDKFRDAALRTLAMFALIALTGVLVAGLVGWKLAYSVSRPARALARASEAIAKGDFSKRLPISLSAGPSCGDEIGALVQAFNTMAESLKERDELLKRRTRLQLTRSERLAAVGRLAAGVAHEINNPLTGVLTFSHLLLRDAPENSREREDLQAIIDATTRCRDVTRGLLNFSRQNEPQKTVSGVNQVLRESLNLTRNQALLNQVEIREEMDAELPPLVIDPNQIQEVAVNVILNAIDAMREGGTLTVRTRAVERDGQPAVELEISDTGTGIREEDLDHIFDPFFTTKPPGEGTGLGLAISYGIATEHGGEIRVSSTPNRGTSVTVQLPAGLKEDDDEKESTDSSGR